MEVPGVEIDPHPRAIDPTHDLQHLLGGQFAVVLHADEHATFGRVLSTVIDGIGRLGHAVGRLRQLSCRAGEEANVGGTHQHGAVDP